MFQLFKRHFGTGKKDIYGLNPQTLHNIGTACTMQDEFNIIHDHHGTLLAKTSVIMPMHGPFTKENIPLYKEFTNPYLITLSDSQLPPNLKFPNYLGTVYNGLNMESYPYSEKNDGYLLFVGRISEEKGTHKAIKVAQALNLPVIIAAKLDLKEDRLYFEKHVKAHLSEKIRWIDQVDEKRKISL